MSFNFPLKILGAVFVFLFLINLRVNSFAYEPIDPPECANVTFAGIVTNNSNLQGLGGATVQISNAKDPSSFVQTTSGSDGKFSIVAPCNPQELLYPDDESYRTFYIGIAYGEDPFCERGNMSRVATETQRSFDVDLVVGGCGPQTCSHPVFTGRVTNSGFRDGLPYATITFENQANSQYTASYITGADGSYNIVVPCNPEENKYLYPANLPQRTYKFYVGYQYSTPQCETQIYTHELTRGNANYPETVAMEDIDIATCGPQSTNQLPATPPITGQIGIIPTVPGSTINPTPTPTPPVNPPTQVACRDGIRGFGSPGWWQPAWQGNLSQYVKDVFSDTGAKIARIGLDWAQIEVAENTFLYSRQEAPYDAIVDTYVSSGITPTGLFVAAPTWLQPATCNCNIGCRDLNGDGRVDNRDVSNLYCPIPDNKEATFRSAVREIVGHYKGKITYWEFWNEPENYSNGLADPTVYVKWLNIFYDEAKAINPSAVVAAGTDSGVGWFDSVATTAKFDAIVVHPYSGAYHEGPLDRSEVMAVARYGKKVWVTEWGYNTDHIDQNTQANQLVQDISWLNSQSYVQFATFHTLADDNGTNYGLLTANFFSSGNILANRRQAYNAFKSLGACSYTNTSAGTCIQPMTFMYKPSCEILTISAPMTKVSEQKLNEINIGTAIAPIWKSRWEVKFERDWSTGYRAGSDWYELVPNPTYSTYFKYAEDPDKKPVVVMYSGDPNGKEKFKDTYDITTKKYTFVPGLIHYFSNPTQIEQYNNSDYDIKTTNPPSGAKNAKAEVLLPGPSSSTSSAIKIVSNSANGDPLISSPTQTALGGARLEWDFGPLAVFSHEKTSCSIVGRPGDALCGTNSSIYDFKKYAVATENMYKNMAMADLQLPGGSLACGTPATDTNKQSNLLASAIPMSTLSINTEKATTEIASTGSVAGASAVSCYSNPLSSQDVSCPYVGTTTTTAEKTKLNLTGKSTKTINCEVTSLLIPALSADCSETVELAVKHETQVRGESQAIDLGINLFQSIFGSPFLRYNVSMDSERKHNESTGDPGITVKPSGTGFIVDGKKYKCIQDYGISSVDRPGNPQPASDCFVPPTTPTPIPTTTACGTGGVTWNNANSHTFDSQSTKAEIEAGVGIERLPIIDNGQGTVTLCGSIIPVDPVSLTLARSPCSRNPGDMPRHSITIEYTDRNGVAQVVRRAFTSWSVDPVFYSLVVPKGSRIGFVFGGENNSQAGASWDRTLYNISTATSGNCSSRYVFNQPSGYDATKTFCGVSQDCNDIFTLALWSNFANSQGGACVSAVGGESSCRGGDDVERSCRGRALACELHGSSVLQPQTCTTCPDSANNRINMADVILEDVDCNGDNCIAVGWDKNDNVNKGYIFRSTNKGGSWEASYRTNQMGHLYRVSYQNANEVFVTGRNGFVGWSDSGGKTSFSNESLQVEGVPQGYLLGLKAFGVKSAYMSGTGQHIWLTTNYGAEWKYAPDPGGTFFTNNATISDFAVSPNEEADPSQGTVVAVSQGSYLIKTPGKTTWEKVNIMNMATMGVTNSCNISHIRFWRTRFTDTTSYRDFLIVGELPQEHGGGKGCIAKCTNYDSCVDATLDPTKGMRGLDFYSGGGSDVALAVGDAGYVLKSVDKGASWQKITVPGFSERLYAVKIINGSTAVAVGEKGSIIRTTTLNTSSVKWKVVTARQINFSGETW